MVLPTTDSKELLIIEDPLKLEHWVPVEPSLLTDSPGFGQSLDKAWVHYREVLQDPTRNERPYQPLYAAIACSRRHNLWGHAMGAGKTTMSLLLIQTLYSPIENKRPGLVHIMVPGILAAQRWLQDAGLIASLEGCIDLIQNERDLLKATAPILLYSYDFPKQRAKSAPPSRPFCSRVLAHHFRPALLIVDEVHNVNPKTQRYQHVEYLRRKSRRFLGLSGTLSDGNLQQIHSVCRLTYQNFWPYGSAEFVRHFGQKATIKSHYLGHQRPEDSKDREFHQLNPTTMPEYYRTARRFIHRVLLSDPEVASCIKVPVSSIQLEGLAPTAEQLQQFREYCTLHRQELQAAAALKDVRYRAQALRLLHPLVLLTNAWSTATPKTNRVVEIVRNAEGKVAVFCDSVAGARTIFRILQATFGKAVVRLYGQDPLENPKVMQQDDRVALINQLQFDPNCKVAVLSINLTAQAIDLTSCSDAILYCLPWSSVKVMQALARAVRPGNLFPKVTSHYLYQYGLIDEHKVAIVTQKIKNAKVLLDYDLDKPEESGTVDPAEVIKRLLAGF